jgi:hypothetical protein
VGALALAAPLASIADHQRASEAYVQAPLLEAAEDHPDAVFSVNVSWVDLALRQERDQVIHLIL